MNSVSSGQSNATVVEETTSKYQSNISSPLQRDDRFNDTITTTSIDIKVFPDDSNLTSPSLDISQNVNTSLVSPLPPTQQSEGKVDSTKNTFVDKIAAAARNTNYKVQEAIKNTARRLKNFFTTSNKQLNATQTTEQSNFTSTLQ